MTAVLDKSRLTDFSHGCGCKIASAILSELFAAAPIRGLPQALLVGTGTAADETVYKL